MSDQSDSSNGREVAALLARCAAALDSLDRVFAKTWERIAPDEAPYEPLNVSESVKKLLAAGPGAGADSIGRAIDTVTEHVGALVEAFPEAARTFADRHLMIYSPDAIEKVPAGVFKNRDASCWKKYKELAAGLSAASITYDIRRALAVNIIDRLGGGPADGRRGQP